jgi:chorismate mutase/prephenate dehydratase
MRDLKEIRKEIDEIDDQITSLYLRRLELAKDVAMYKLSKDLPVFDKKREDEKLSVLSEKGSDEFEKNGISELFTQIMSGNRKKQYKILSERDKNKKFSYECVDNFDFSGKKICFQGVKGAYSEKAAIAFFGEKSDLHSVPTWKDAVYELFSGTSDFAVVPVENSSAGTVNEIFDLLYQYPVCIIGQKTIKIDHALLGIKGADISNIRTIYSHPQALMQCSDFLNNNSGIRTIATENTAFSAKKVMEDNSVFEAAIGDKKNAAIYNLEVLKSSIQNDSTNETRFLILSKNSIYSKDADLISICIELNNNKGSLYHALSNFTYNGLNMTHIVSRPIFGRPWEYRFFIEIEGNLNDEAVLNALYCLKQETCKIKILGNYKSN